MSDQTNMQNGMGNQQSSQKTTRLTTSPTLLSDVVQAAIAILIISVAAFQVVARQALSPDVKDLSLIIIGYYFGRSVGLKLQ